MLLPRTTGGRSARENPDTSRSILLIFDIGYLAVIPGSGNLFFQLVNARYEKGAP
jgi:hypothetical protein